MRSTEARHACDQGDELDHYTWTQFDAREGGIQVLKDSKNNVQVTTELLMVDGGEHGGSWAARIKGKPIIEGIIFHARPRPLRPHHCVSYRETLTYFFYLLRWSGRNGRSRLGNR